MKQPEEPPKPEPEPLTLPRITPNGEPARAWCHSCIPVEAFRSIEDLQRHNRQIHSGGRRRR
jgi:hypothetical protein